MHSMLVDETFTRVMDRRKGLISYTYFSGWGKDYDWVSCEEVFDTAIER